MKEAMYYKISDEQIICTLCPHTCKLNDGETGLCGVRKNIGNKLYSLSYGKIGAMSVDPMRKKPIYNFMADEQVFSIGTFGCNLSCDFCQNHELVVNTENIVNMTPEQLISMVEERNLCALAYTYNEPITDYEFVLESAKLARRKSIANVLVTNGYINSKPFEELLKYIDAANIDLKSMKDSFYKEICGGSLRPVIESIKLASKYTHVEVSTLIIGSENDSEEDMESEAKLLASIDKNITLHINRYFPRYKRHDPSTNIDKLYELKKIADTYLKHVYVGNV